MRLRIPVLVVFCLALFSPYLIGETDSCRGHRFMPEDLKALREVPSPDAKYGVVLGGYRDEKDSESGWLRVVAGNKTLRQYRLTDLSAGMYLEWAPDSRAFFLMWSDGGAIGNFHVRVFRVMARRAVEKATMKIAEQEFAKKHYCKARGNNAYALRWLNDSNQLLIATGVYPTGDCGKDLGLTFGYVVRTDSGAILKRYSQSEIEAQMKACSPFMS